MVMPYEPSNDEQKLLDCYDQSVTGAVIGFDGVASKHLQALVSVQKLVAEDTRAKVLAELSAADLGALLRVADAASILLSFTDMAIRSKSPLRAEAEALAKRLHGLLNAAGYTDKSQFTGHHQRPGFAFSARDYID